MAILVVWSIAFGVAKRHQTKRLRDLFCFSFATNRTTDFVNFRHRRHGGRGSGTGDKAVNRTSQVIVAGTLRGMSLGLTALSRILISRQNKHCKSALNSLTLRVMSTMNIAEWQAFRDLVGVPELKRLVSYFDKVCTSV